MSFTQYGFSCDSISNPFPSKNHDSFRVLESAISVTDGATPLNVKHSDTSVRNLSNLVSDLLVTSELRSPIDRFINVSHSCESSGSDTAVAAAVWLDSEFLIGAVVGDCTIAIRKFDQSISILTDTTLESLDNEVVQAMNDPRVRRDQKHINDLLLKNRSLVNVPGGYGAFGIPGMTPQHIVTSQIPISEVQTVLVCSDGFWRSLQPYHIFENVQQFLTSAVDGLGPIVARIRDVEESDPEATIIPRISQADDITAVLLHRTS